MFGHSKGQCRKSGCFVVCRLFTKLLQPRFMELNAIMNESESIKDWIIDIRRELHRFPELMYEEHRTNELVREKLDELGIEYEFPIAETGVLASIGNGDGPCIALRADMDALPIHETADVDFKSEIDGKMHACGHDCHTCLLYTSPSPRDVEESRMPSSA